MLIVKVGFWLKPTWFVWTARATLLSRGFNHAEAQPLEAEDDNHKTLSGRSHYRIIVATLRGMRKNYTFGKNDVVVYNGGLIIMDGRYLTGFQVASPANVRHVQRPDEDGGEFDVTNLRQNPLSPMEYRSAQRQGSNEAGRRSAVAQHISALNVGFDTIKNTTVQDWDGLTGFLDAWSDDAFSSLARYDEPNRLSAVDAAKEGCSTLVAFLEVCGRVLFRRDFAEPNESIYRYARRSQGFISEWGKLDEVVDYQLAFALARPKPRHIADVYKGLRFDPGRFTANHEHEQITLDSARVPNLRGSDHQSHPEDYLRKKGPKAILGCVALHIIPQLYQAAGEAARRNGLFGATYEEERINHALSVGDAPS